MGGEPVVEVGAARAGVVPADVLDLVGRQLSRATESDERLGRYLVLIRRAQWFALPWFGLAGGGVGLVVWAGGGSWAAAVGVGVLTACGATGAWFAKLARKAVRAG